MTTHSPARLAGWLHSVLISTEVVFDTFAFSVLVVSWYLVIDSRLVVDSDHPQHLYLERLDSISIYTDYTIFLTKKRWRFRTNHGIGQDSSIAIAIDCDREDIHNFSTTFYIRFHSLGLSDTRSTDDPLIGYTLRHEPHSHSSTSLFASSFI